MSINIFTSGLMAAIASNAVSSFMAVIYLAAIAYIGIGLMRVSLSLPSVTT